MVSAMDDPAAGLSDVVALRFGGHDDPVIAMQIFGRPLPLLRVPCGTEHPRLRGLAVGDHGLPQAPFIVDGPSIDQLRVVSYIVHSRKGSKRAANFVSELDREAAGQDKVRPHLAERPEGTVGTHTGSVDALAPVAAGICVRVAPGAQQHRWDGTAVVDSVLGCAGMEGLSPVPLQSDRGHGVGRGVHIHRGAEVAGIEVGPMTMEVVR